MEAPRRGELATLGLFVSGPRLEDMAEMEAGEGDRDMVAIKLSRQHALRRKRYAGRETTLGYQGDFKGCEFVEGGCSGRGEEGLGTSSW